MKNYIIIYSESYYECQSDADVKIKGVYKTFEEAKQGLENAVKQMVHEWVQREIAWNKKNGYTTSRTEADLFADYEADIRYDEDKTSCYCYCVDSGIDFWIEEIEIKL